MVEIALGPGWPGERTLAYADRLTLATLSEQSAYRQALDYPAAGVDRRGDPRRGGDRRGPGRPVDVVPPAAARHLPRRPGRRHGSGRRLAAPLGLADDARRARHRGAAGLRAARRAGRAAPTRSCRRTSPTTSARHDLPVLRPVRVDQVVEAGDGLLVVHAGDRHLADPHDRERDRHLDAAVRAALPRRRRRSAASSCTPSTTPAREHSAAGACRRGRRRVGGAAARRDRAGRRRHPLGDPARAGLAHRRLQPRGRSRGGRAGRGAGPPRPAAGQRRERDRAGAARAGARGRAARSLRAAPDVHARSSPTACGCPTARSGRPT